MEVDDLHYMWNTNKLNGIENFELIPIIISVRIELRSGKYLQYP